MALSTPSNISIISPHQPSSIHFLVYCPLPTAVTEVVFLDQGYTSALTLTNYWLQSTDQNLPAGTNLQITYPPGFQLGYRAPVSCAMYQVDGGTVKATPIVTSVALQTIYIIWTQSTQQNEVLVGCVNIRSPLDPLPIELFIKTKLTVPIGNVLSDRVHSIGQVSRPTTPSTLGHVTRSIAPLDNEANKVTSLVVTVEPVPQSLRPGSTISFSLPQRFQANQGGTTRCYGAQNGRPLFGGITSVRQDGTGSSQRTFIDYTLSVPLALSMGPMNDRTVLTCSNIRNPPEPTDPLTPSFYPSRETIRVTSDDQTLLYETDLASVDPIRTSSFPTTQPFRALYYVSGPTTRTLRIQWPLFTWYVSNPRDIFTLNVPSSFSTSSAQCGMSFQGNNISPLSTSAVNGTLLLLFASQQTSPGVPDPTTLATQLPAVGSTGNLLITCNNVGPTVTALPNLQSAPPTEIVGHRGSTTGADPTQLTDIKQAIDGYRSSASILSCPEGELCNDEPSLSSSTNVPLLRNHFGSVLAPRAASIFLTGTAPNAFDVSVFNGQSLIPTPVTSTNAVAQHSVGLVGSIGDLTVDMTFEEELTRGTILRIPLASQYSTRPNTLCTLDGNAMPYSTGCDSSLPQDQCAYISGVVETPVASGMHTSVLRCTNILLGGTMPQQILGAIKIQKVLGPLITLIAGILFPPIHPVPAITRADAFHESDRTYTLGNMLVTLIDTKNILRHGEGLSLVFNQGLIDATGTQCRATVNGIEQTDAVTQVAAQTPTTIRLSGMFIPPLADIQLLCSNVRRGRFTYPLITTNLFQVLGHSGPVAENKTATLNGCTEPQTLNGTGLSVTFTPVYTTLPSTLFLNIERLPVPIISGDVFEWAPPTAWVWLGGMIVSFSTGSSNIAGTLLSGTDTPMRVRIGGNVPAGSPLVLIARSFRNPADEGQPDTTTGVTVYDALDRVLFAEPTATLAKLFPLSFDMDTSFNKLFNTTMGITLVISEVSTGFSTLNVTVPYSWLPAPPTVCYHSGVPMDFIAVNNGTFSTLSMSVRPFPAYFNPPQSLICDGFYIPSSTSQRVDFRYRLSGGALAVASLAVGYPVMGSRYFEILSPLWNVSALTDVTVIINSMPLPVHSNMNAPVRITLAYPPGWRFYGNCTLSQYVTQFLANFTSYVLDDGRTEFVATALSGPMTNYPLNITINCTHVNLPPVMTPDTMSPVSVYFYHAGRADIAQRDILVPATTFAQFLPSATFTDPIAGRVNDIVLELTPFTYADGDSIFFQLPSGFTIPQLNLTKCHLNDSEGFANLTTTFNTNVVPPIISVQLPPGIRHSFDGKLTCTNIRNSPYARPATTDLYAGITNNQIGNITRVNITNGPVQAIQAGPLGSRVAAIGKMTLVRFNEPVSIYVDPSANDIPAYGGVNITFPDTWTIGPAIECIVRSNDRSIGTVGTRIAGFSLAVIVNFALIAPAYINILCLGVVPPANDFRRNDAIITTFLPNGGIIDSTSSALVLEATTPFSYYEGRQVVTFPLKRRLVQKEIDNMVNALREGIGGRIAIYMFSQTLGGDQLNVTYHVQSIDASLAFEAIGRAALRQPDLVDIVRYGTGLSVTSVSVPEVVAMPLSCVDGLTNDGESGQDCGGTSRCWRCPVGRECHGNADCFDNICRYGICLPNTSGKKSAATAADVSLPTILAPLVAVVFAVYGPHYLDWVPPAHPLLGF